MFTASASRAAFQERWSGGLPLDGFALNHSAEDRRLLAVKKLIAAGLSKDLRPVVKAVYVGYARESIMINAEAVRMFGQAPFIAIYPRLDIALRCAVGLHEASLDLARRALGAGGLVTPDQVADWMDTPWRDLRSWAALTRVVVTGSTKQAMDASLKVDHLLALAPADEKARRPIRLEYCWTFLVAHELGHVLLGHIGGAPQAAVAAAALHAVGLLSPPTNQELECDVLGVLFGCVRPNERPPLDAIRAAARHAQAGDSLVALMVAITAAGFDAIFANPSATAGHPHPRDRLAVVYEVLAARMGRLDELAGGRKNGPEGPEFIQRQLRQGLPQMRSLAEAQFELVKTALTMR